MIRGTAALRLTRLGLRPIRTACLWSALWALSAFVFVFSGLPGAGTMRQACAADGNHAGMVIRSSASAGSERSWCLQFSQESISGIEALRLTGLPVVTKSFGAEGEYVCKIGDVGSEAADCPAKDGSYWGYWRMTADGWRHSGIGASSARVRCGSLEGWAWLEGGSGPAPSASAFSSICRSAACRESNSAVTPPDAPTGSALRGPGSPSVPEGRPPAAAGTGDAAPSRLVPGEPAPASAPVGSQPAERGAREPPAVSGISSEAKSPGPLAPAKPGETQDPQGPNATASASGVAASRRDSPGPPLAVLGGIIAVLAAARGYLFWRSRAAR